MSTRDCLGLSLRGGGVELELIPSEEDSEEEPELEMEDDTLERFEEGWLLADSPAE